VFEPSWLFTIDLTEVETFRTKFINNFKEEAYRTRAQDFLKRDRWPFGVDKVQKTATMHAEASLMSLALTLAQKGEERTVDGSIHDRFASGLVLDEVVIGVSKRCCLCCHLLAEALHTHTKMNFVLPGTRASLHPWLAPSNVPATALRSVRDDLFRILIDLAMKHGQSISRSSQTSSVSDSSDQVPLDDITV